MRFLKFILCFATAMRLTIADATYDIWLGNTSVNWNTANNWVGSTVPITGTNIILMSAGSSGTSLNNNIGAGLSIKSLTYSNAASAFTLHGNSFTITGGITNLSANAQNITNAIVLGANSTFNDSGSGLNFVGIISAAFGITNAGTISFNAQNSFTGDVTINSGTVTALSAGGSTTGNLGGGAANRLITINSGATLTFPVNNIFGGSGTVVANIPTVVLNGGTLSTSGSAYDQIVNITLNSGGTMNFAGDNNSGLYRSGMILGTVTAGGSSGSTIASAAPLNLYTNNIFNIASTGDATADLTVSAVLMDGNGDWSTLNGGFTKTGAGKMLLTGANTYQSNTIILGGTLAVSGSGSITSSIAIVVSNATFDISGKNSAMNYPKSITLTNATWTLGTVQATNNSISTTNSTISLSIDPVLNYVTNLITGTLTLRGSTNTITLTRVGASTVYPTNIPLIAYSSGSGLTNGVNNNLTNIGVILPTAGSPTGYLTNNNTKKTIDFVLTAGGLPPLVWSGVTNSVSDGNWNTSDTNWNSTYNTAIHTSYSDSNSAVLFDDSVSGATNVVLTTTLSPSSIIVSNATKPYIFTGSGSISGTNSLVKTNTGTLILDNSGVNNFSGGSTIAQGTLQIGNNDANGNLTGAIIDNATLSFNQSADKSFTNIVSGTGSIVQNGTNTLTIGGVSYNTFSGGLTINSGTVAVTNQTFGNSPLGTGNVTVNNGATLQGNNGDAFGYAPNTAPQNINLLGGTMTVLANSSYRVTLPNFTIMGGRITAPSTASGDAFGIYSFYGDGAKCSITTLATNITSIIDTMSGSAFPIANQSPVTFNVASGSVVGGTYTGIDLVVLSGLSDFTAQGIPWIKTGSGVIALDGNSQYLGYFGADSITISNGTLQVGLSTDTAQIGNPLGRDYLITTTNLATLKFGSSQGFTINNIITGSGILINAAGTNTLSATNTYTGATTISGGILKLAATGSISNSASVSIAAGSTFDVSSQATFNGLSNSTPLTFSGTGTAIGSTAAEIKGGTTVNFKSSPIVFNLTPTAFTGDTAHPPLLISSGALVLTNSAITVSNLASTKLSSGVYQLAQVTGGSITGLSNSTLTVSGMAVGRKASLSISGGNLNIIVQPICPWNFD